MEKKVKFEQKLFAFIVWGLILILFIILILNYFYPESHSWRSIILMSSFIGSRDFSILVLSVSAALATTLLYHKLEEEGETTKSFLKIIFSSLLFSYIIMWVLCLILWSILTIFNLS